MRISKTCQNLKKTSFFDRPGGHFFDENDRKSSILAFLMVRGVKNRVSGRVSGRKSRGGLKASHTGPILLRWGGRGVSKRCQKCVFGGPGCQKSDFGCQKVVWEVKMASKNTKMAKTGSGK